MELDDALLQLWAQEFPSDGEGPASAQDPQESAKSLSFSSQDELRRQLQVQQQTEARLQTERRQREVLFSTICANGKTQASESVSEQSQREAIRAGENEEVANSADETSSVEESLATAADDLRAVAIRFRRLLNTDNDRLQKMQQKQSELQGEAVKGCSQTKKLLRSEWFAAFLPLVLLAVALCMFLAVAALIFATPG